MNNEKIQQAYLQLQMIEQQLKDIEAQIMDIENRKHEISTMSESIGELKKTKKNSSTFAPLGLGIYAKSKLVETTELLVNVGSNIFVKKPLADISKSLDKQIKKGEGELLINSIRFKQSYQPTQPGVFYCLCTFSDS